MILKTQLKTISSALLTHKYIYTLLILFSYAPVAAQVTPGKKKPDPISSVRPRVADKTTDKAPEKPASKTPEKMPERAPEKPAVTMPDIREKLVQLALQNPDYEIANRRLAIAGYQVKKAKGSWLSTVAVQGNLNEFAFKGDQVGANGVVYNPSTFYPKYNIGVNLPFSLVSDHKNDVKIAKENFSIAQAEKNQHYRVVKAQVLTKYEDYLLCQQKLDFQSQVTQDARTAYLAAEKDFQEGAIKQEDYNKSYRAYTDEKIKQAEFVRNYNVVKLEMEAMIGISIDDLQPKK